MSNKDNKKLGIGIYYTAIIITIVVMLLTLVVIKSDDLEYVSRMRYMISFYCFSFLLGGGIIVREFLVEEFIMKKMLLKIVVTAVAIVLGTILFIFIKSASFALVMMFVSMAVLLYDMVPTVPKDSDSKQK